jgi:hypothetical protein
MSSVGNTKTPFVTSCQATLAGRAPIEQVLSVMSPPLMQHNLLGLDEHFAVGGVNKI